MARKAVSHLPLITLLCLLLSIPAVADYKINYIHTDHRGAPVAMTDQSQTVIWRASYKPFGEAVLQEDPDGDGVKTVMNIRYPGQYYDQETGTYYNYYRDYDPGLGRYIQSDPIGIKKDYSDPQMQVAMRMGIPFQSNSGLGINHVYGYAEQNPLINTDPFGLDTICGNDAVWIYDSSENGGGYCRPTRDQGPQCYSGDCAALPASTGDSCVQACINQYMSSCMSHGRTGVDLFSSFLCASAVMVLCSENTCNQNQCPNI